MAVATKEENKSFLANKYLNTFYSCLSLVFFCCKYTTHF